MDMGGYGSGRYRRPSRQAHVEDFCAADVRTWQREGLLQPGQPFTRIWTENGRLVQRHEFLPGRDVLLVLRAREPERLRLEWTRCNYGGSRPWFLCPGCGSRRAKLFEVGDRFVCRGCGRLGYQSQQERPGDRLALRAKRLAARIGGGGVLPNTLTGKPPRMHWRTYALIEQRAAAAWAASVEAREQEIVRRCATLPPHHP